MASEGLKMRPSRVLRKLRAGEVASCMKLNLADPRVVEIAAMSDFDCVWLDMEHVPNTLDAIENQIRAAKLFDVDTLVRVQRGSYSDLIHPLEMDAAGIMVPHLMSLADARALREIVPAGYVQTAPLDPDYHQVDLRSGPIAEGRDFGNRSNRIARF